MPGAHCSTVKGLGYGGERAVVVAQEVGSSKALAACLVHTAVHLGEVMSLL